MTIQQGSIILANDYNNAIGNPPSSTDGSNVVLMPFDVNSVQNALGAVYGIGYADRGYGLSSVPLYKHTVIQGSDYINIKSAIVEIAAHQGTNISNIVPDSNLQQGQLIKAFNGVNSNNDSLFDLIPTIDANRFNTNGGLSMALLLNQYNDTRTTSWSSVISTELSVNFSSEDACRYFFNTGGEIRIRIIHPDSSTPHDQDWVNILNTKIGTFAFKANSTSITGTLGTSYLLNNGTVGYYNLLTSYVDYLIGTNIGGYNGIYTSNDVYIATKYSGNTTNGAKGSSVQFRVTLQDQYSGYGDPVAAGTKIEIDVLKASNPLTHIETPSISSNGIVFG